MKKIKPIIYHRIICTLLYIAMFILYTNTALNADNIFDTQTRYTFKIDFNKQDHIADVVQTVRFVNNTDTLLSELHFNVYPNKRYTANERKILDLYQSYFKINMFPDGLQYPELDISYIELDGQLLQYDIAETVLVVLLNSPLDVGQSVEIVIKFKLKLPQAFGVLGYYRGISSFGHWYPILSVYKNGKWHDNPIGADHQPYFSDASYYDVELIIDADQIVAHTGITVAEQKIDDIRKKIDIKTDLVRDFTFTASSSYKIIEEKTKGVSVKFYYLQENEACAKEGLKLAVSAMNFYIETFGPYPYPEFSIVEANIGWLGNEFSNIIFLDSRGLNLPDVLYRHLDFLISHEMAHQWWYVQVGSDQYAETWLDEAFASYAGNLYLESKYGVDNNYLQLPEWGRKFLPNTTFKEARTQRYLQAAKNDTDEKILQPISEFKSPENVFIAAYDKGLWVLEMLRYVVTDAVFFEIMREYIQRYQYKTASVENFVATAEEVSGVRLDWFFEQWLTTTKKCDYGIENVSATHNAGDAWNTKYTVKRYGEIIMPVDILVETEDGERIVEMWGWEGQEESKGFSITTNSKVKRITVDPEQALLDYRRQNNYWPHNIKVRFTPYYPLLYDFPIFNPSDAYSVTVGFPINLYNAGFRIAGRRVFDYMSYFDCRYDYYLKRVYGSLGHQMEHAFGPDTQVDLELGYFHSTYDSEEVRKAKIGFTKKLGPTINAIDKMLNDITLYVIRDREVDAEDADDKVINRSRIGLTYNFDNRVLAWDPIGGSRLMLNLEKGFKALNSNTDFIKGEADFRYYQKLWDTEHVIATRLNLGLSDGDVLGDERFKMGGRNSLRGYSEEKIKSQNKFLFSGEYRFPLIRRDQKSVVRNFFTFNRLHGAAFYDAGFPWDEHFSIDDVVRDVRSNVGLGLRFEVTVLGFFEKTINRLDAAVPIDGSNRHVHVWFEITHAF
jgi:hypothetical protein